MIDREGVTCESGINRKDREVFYLDWKRNEINKNGTKSIKTYHGTHFPGAVFYSGKVPGERKET